MNKERALDIAITAMFREILREDEPVHRGPRIDDPPYEDPNPQPRFDFDESADTCEHGGMRIPRSECPIHGDDAQRPVSIQELDDIANETPEEENPTIARARRLAAQRVQQQNEARLFPEEIPMRGMGPPPGDEPPLVV